MDIKLVSENVMKYRLLTVSNVFQQHTYLITEINSAGRQHFIQETIVNIISSRINLNVLPYDMTH